MKPAVALITIKQERFFIDLCLVTPSYPRKMACIHAMRGDQPARAPTLWHMHVASSPKSEGLPSGLNTCFFSGSFNGDLRATTRQL